MRWTYLHIVEQIVLAMDRKPIGEPALLRGDFELRWAPNGRLRGSLGGETSVSGNVQKRGEIQYYKGGVTR